MTDYRISIGYVHVGPHRHGVRRFGELLAQEARKRADLEVFEKEIRLTGNDQDSRRSVLVAARQLSGCDVVHVQFNNQSDNSVWGAGWLQLRYLKLFLRNCTSRVVVTLHDVYGYIPVPNSLLSLVGSFAPSFVEFGGLPVRLRRWLCGDSIIRAATLDYILREVEGYIVCSQEEGRRIQPSQAREGTTVIPHFVESRHLEFSNSDAKAALGLATSRVVTLLGYIHKRKGWRLLLEALPLMPADIFLVFAGEPTAREEIERCAQERGVADRVRITGYLSETQLNLVLAATDVAVCPFLSVSASGSLSTWLSARRPIVASELPLFEEYNQMSPGAISLFSPYEAESLAQCLVNRLQDDAAMLRERIDELCTQLCIERVLDRHLKFYRGCTN